jgi:hypothetical protein
MHFIYRVNRTFNQIVSPIMYQDINLLLTPIDDSAFGRVTQRVLLPQAQSIRSLYLWANPIREGSDEQLRTYTLELLRACSNIKYLGLYFKDSFLDTIPNREWVDLRQTVLHMVEHGNLSYLGLYSIDVLSEWFDSECFSAVKNLIESLAASEPARIRLKGLDLAVTQIKSDTYDVIRSKFTGLESLVVRTAFGVLHGRVWDYGQQSKWSPYNSLRSLRFYGCSGAYSAHIPNLVSIFPALRELLISACGDNSDAPFRLHEEEWYLSPDALCNTHAPLDWFHIDHMDDWEIRGMGTIPTRTLIITSVKSFHLLNELRNDSHLFPRMEVLRLKRPSDGPRENTKSLAKLEELEKICQKRGVQILRDADTIFVCHCCGKEGF